MCYYRYTNFYWQRARGARGRGVPLPGAAGAAIYWLPHAAPNLYSSCISSGCASVLKT